MVCHAQTKVFVPYNLPHPHDAMLGIVKTHRLSLDVPEDDMAPNVPDSAPESTAKILVGAGVIKELLDHFQGFRKSDPQLQWEFDAADVKVKTVMHGAKGTGKCDLVSSYSYKRCFLTWFVRVLSKDGGIASEISVEASEFSDYTVPHAPLGMCFQLKEFEVSSDVPHFRLECMCC